MNLLYLIGSVAGIAVLVGLNILLFGRSAARADAGALAARLALDVPGFRAGASAVSSDGRTAVIENAADGALYLARIEGDGFAVRKLARGVLRRSTRDGQTLDLRLRDFTFPGARLLFADEREAEDWQSRLARVGAP